MKNKWILATSTILFSASLAACNGGNKRESIEENADHTTQVMNDSNQSQLESNRNSSKQEGGREDNLESSEVVEEEVSQVIAFSEGKETEINRVIEIAEESRLTATTSQEEVDFIVAEAADNLTSNSSTSDKVLDESLEKAEITIKKLHSAEQETKEENNDKPVEYRPAVEVKPVQTEKPTDYQVKPLAQSDSFQYEEPFEELQFDHTDEPNYEVVHTNRKKPDEKHQMKLQPEEPNDEAINANEEKFDQKSSNMDKNQPTEDLNDDSNKAETNIDESSAEETISNEITIETPSHDNEAFTDGDELNLEVQEDMNKGDGNNSSEVAEFPEESMNESGSVQNENVSPLTEEESLSNEVEVSEETSEGVTGDVITPVDSHPEILIQDSEINIEITIQSPEQLADDESDYDSKNLSLRPENLNDTIDESVSSAETDTV